MTVDLAHFAGHRKKTKKNALARSRPGLWTEVERAINPLKVVLAVFIFGDLFYRKNFTIFFLVSPYCILPIFSLVCVLLGICVCLCVCVASAYVHACWHM